MVNINLIINFIHIVFQYFTRKIVTALLSIWILNDLELENEIRPFWFCCHMLSGNGEMGPITFKTQMRAKYFNPFYLISTSMARTWSIVWKKTLTFQRCPLKMIGFLFAEKWCHVWLTYSIEVGIDVTVRLTFWCKLLFNCW